MEGLHENIVIHPDYTIHLTGNPQLVQGKIGKALQFSQQGQYASLGEHREDCLGNLDYCHHGVLLSSWVKFGDMVEDMQYMSTGQNGIKMWYEDGKVVCSFGTSTKQWTLPYDGFYPDQWFFIEYSWHAKKGLHLYVNNRLVAEATNTSDKDGQYNKKLNGVYFAHGEVPDDGLTGNITFDEIEYTYADRDYLTAFGYIDRGKDAILMENSRLKNPSFGPRVSNLYACQPKPMYRHFPFSFLWLSIPRGRAHHPLHSQNTYLHTASTLTFAACLIPGNTIQKHEEKTKFYPV